MENSFSHESCMCWAQVLHMIMEAHRLPADRNIIARQLGRTLKNGIFLECVRIYLRKAGFVFIERDNQTWESVKIWHKIAQDYGGHVAVEIWDKRDYEEVRDRLASQNIPFNPIPPDEHALIVKGLGKGRRGEFITTYDPGYERVYRFRKDQWMSMWFKMTDETRPLNERTGENVTRRWMMLILRYPEAPMEREIFDKADKANIFPEVKEYLREIGEPDRD